MSQLVLVLIQLTRAMSWSDIENMLPKSHYKAVTCIITEPIKMFRRKKKRYLNVLRYAFDLHLETDESKGVTLYLSGLMTTALLKNLDRERLREFFESPTTTNVVDFLHLRPSEGTVLINDLGYYMRHTTRNVINLSVLCLQLPSLLQQRFAKSAEFGSLKFMRTLCISLYD